MPKGEYKMDFADENRTQNLQDSQLQPVPDEVARGIPPLPLMTRALLLLDDTFNADESFDP